MRFASGVIRSQLIADLCIGWATRPGNGNSIVQECCAAAAFNGSLDLVDSLTVEFRNLTSGPQAVPALESSLLDVVVVDKDEDGEENLKDNDGEKAKRVKVQETFCEWKKLVNGNAKSHDNQT